MPAMITWTLSGQEQDGKFYDERGRYQHKNGRYYDELGRYQGGKAKTENFYDELGRYRLALMKMVAFITLGR